MIHFVWTGSCSRRIHMTVTLKEQIDALSVEGVSLDNDRYMGRCFHSQRPVCFLHFFYRSK